jgi:hypothetical protein
MSVKILVKISQPIKLLLSFFIVAVNLNGSIITLSSRLAVSMRSAATQTIKQQHNIYSTPFPSQRANFYVNRHIEYTFERVSAARSAFHLKIKHLQTEVPIAAVGLNNVVSRLISLGLLINDSNDLKA